MDCPAKREEMNKSLKIKNSILTGVANDFIRYASGPVEERSFLEPKGGIKYSAKVSLMEQYHFLRTFDNLNDLDKATDIVRKVLLMGDRSVQNRASKWMADNDRALDIHQELRKEIRSAELIEEVFGSALILDDEEMIPIFKKCRRENMADSVGSGLFGLMRGKKSRAYENETESAVNYLKLMQDSYSVFMKTVGKDYDELGRSDFSTKWNII